MVIKNNFFVFLFLKKYRMHLISTQQLDLSIVLRMCCNTRHKRHANYNQHYQSSLSQIDIDGWLSKICHQILKMANKRKKKEILEDNRSVNWTQCISYLNMIVNVAVKNKVSTFITFILLSFGASSSKVLHISSPNSLLVTSY